MNTPNANIPYRLCTALLAILCIQDVYARCGSVDYSWGADGLAEATAFVGTMNSQQTHIWHKHLECII